MTPQILEAIINACFKQPRRTLDHNLPQKHYDLIMVPDTTLALRAQQMDFGQLKAPGKFVQAA